MDIENVRAVDYSSVLMVSSEYHISLKSLTEKINERKWMINKALDDSGREVMFNAAWDSYDRDKIISTPIFNRDSLRIFAEVLYMSLFDDTKVRGGRFIVITRKASEKYTLGNLYYESFVQYVNALRNGFAHNKESKNTAKVQPKDVFLHYTGKRTEPNTEEEFRKLQEGMMKEYVTFLEGVIQQIKTDNSHIGKIETDGQNLHCSHILLPKTLSTYVGSECYIKNTTPNNDPQTKALYPNFCLSPEYINCNIVGVVEQDENGVYHVGNIKLDDVFARRKGKGLRILRVKSINPVPNFGYTAEAIMVEYVRLAKKDFADFKYTNTASVSEGIACAVEVDEDGRTHVGNILISKRYKCKKNDIVKLKSIIVNVNPGNDKYPYVAEIDFVERREENLKTNVPYVVEVDESGRLHVKNVIIISEQPLKSGCWVSFERIINNDNPATSKKYPQKGIVKTVIKSDEEERDEKKAKLRFWEKIKRLFSFFRRKK